MFSTKKVFTLMLALGALAYGGGYWLEFANPSASSDPAAKGAVALVRAIGCGEPSKSTVTATAEGVVNGERKSIPLEVIALKSAGVYALKGSVPRDGTWVIAVAGTYLGHHTGSVAAVTAKGLDRKSTKSMPHKPARKDVDAFLLASR